MINIVAKANGHLSKTKFFVCIKVFLECSWKSVPQLN